MKYVNNKTAYSLEFPIDLIIKAQALRHIIMGDITTLEFFHIIDLQLIY